MGTQAMRVVALFLAYGSVGLGGDQVASLLAGDRGPKAAWPTGSLQARGSACDVEAERSVRVDVAADQVLRVHAGSGGLRVEGRAGLDQVRAVGRACASDEAFLDDLRLSLEERGDVVVLTAHYPRRPDRWSDGWTARIDLVVEVPLGMEAELDDSSGSLEVSGTGALRIDDSSGGIHVHGIDGPVEIDDSSGEVELRDVEGDVRVEDGSGSLDLRDVRGSVWIRDGSGSIDVVEVTGGVEVGRDGSGSIAVRGVGGDFTVLRDGSGSIRHSGVSGRVEIPRSKRER